MATQSITGDEWQTIKENTPEVAEQELDVFSDMVWEGVLKKVVFLEHISPKQIHLFSLNETNMKVISMKLKRDIDLTTTEGFNWLRENLLNDDVEFLQANKEYTKDKNLDKFTLIQQGAVITKGDLFKYFNKLIN